MRVLITGSRDFTDEARLRAELDTLPQDDLTIVHGGALGADRLAHLWAVSHYALTEVHEAAWVAYGKLAGHIRNQKMVDLGADLCIAFYKIGAENRGTTNCVTVAKLKGIPIREVWA